MATNTERRVDTSVFGNMGKWRLAQHTEQLTLPSGATLTIQTSDTQTDDGETGTFSVSLDTRSGAPFGTTQIPWGPIGDVRESAVAWCKSLMAETLSGME